MEKEAGRRRGRVEEEVRTVEEEEEEEVEVDLEKVKEGGRSLPSRSSFFRIMWLDCVGATRSVRDGPVSCAGRWGVLGGDEEDEEEGDLQVWRQ